MPKKFTFGVQSSAMRRGWSPLADEVEGVDAAEASEVVEAEEALDPQAVTKALRSATSSTGEARVRRRRDIGLSIRWFTGGMRSPHGTRAA
jgi:hypothetical protein